MSQAFCYSQQKLTNIILFRKCSTQVTNARFLCFQGPGTILMWCVLVAGPRISDRLLRSVYYPLKLGKWGKWSSPLPVSFLTALPWRAGCWGRQRYGIIEMISPFSPQAADPSPLPHSQFWFIILILFKNSMESEARWCALWRSAC